MVDSTLDSASLSSSSEPALAASGKSCDGGIGGPMRMRMVHGTHGVIVPRANVSHLMLDEAVRQAVAERRFAVYATDDIDQCMEILTGREAGAADADGRFPGDTVNGRIVDRLARFAKIRSSMAGRVQARKADAA